MRTLSFLALFLISMLPGIGQTADDAKSSLPKNPREIFAAAAPFYDFSDPALKPWHLKASYQLYDLKGNPTEQGTWEYWWASPKVGRSSWTRGDATRTEWRTADGALYRKESGGQLRYFERTVNTVLLSPLPAQDVLDSGRLKLELKMIAVGQQGLACASTTLQWELNGKLQVPSSATPQHYCFNPSTLALRMTYSDPITTEFNQIVKTQDRYLARQVTILDGKQKLFSISVETIDGMDSSDALLSPAADAVLARAAVSQPPPNEVAGDVTKGSLVKKTPPVYPTIAKMAHEQGVVVLGAVIGTDGRVHDVEVLTSPSPVLADSAVDAVKQWVYKPYLLNGVAVEVETIINVIFKLGQ
jgi:TonB family protein